jgi:hypothetical protein
MAAANFVHQYFHEGYIVFTEGNNTGKICVDSLNSSSLMSTARQQSFLEIFGESACRSMSYRIMERIEIRIDNERSADYAHLTEPIRWRATFLRAPCRKRQVLYLSCSGLGNHQVSFNLIRSVYLILASIQNAAIDQSICIPTALALISPSFRPLTETGRGFRH